MLAVHAEDLDDLVGEVEGATVKTDVKERRRTRQHFLNDGRVGVFAEDRRGVSLPSSLPESDT